MKARIFCGDREWNDPTPIQRAFDRHQPDVTIVGGAPGADTLSEREASLRGSAIERFDAEWVRYGKAAGPIRNGAMLARLLELRRRGYEVGVSAFHSDIAHSKGTGNMVFQARAAGVEVEVIV